MDQNVTPSDRSASQRAPVRLRLLAWLATVGAWGPTRSALARFAPRDQARLRSDIDRLINRLCDSRRRAMSALYLHTSAEILAHALPVAASALTAEQLAAGLDLANRLADAGLDPHGTLRHGLPSAARGLTEQQFALGLDLANRLTLQRIDPGAVLEYGLAPLAQASPTPDTFQTNLQALERLVVLLNARREKPWDALRYGLPAAATLAPAQFTAGLNLAIRLAEKRIDPSGTLWDGLPSAARALTADEFTEAFDLATRLTEQGIDPRDVLQWGVPAVARASPTPETLRVNLRLLEALVIAIEQPGRWTGVPGTEHSNRILAETMRHGLSPAAEALTPEQFTVGLHLAARLAGLRIDPCDTLRYGLAAAAAVPGAGAAGESFQANAAAIEGLVSRLSARHLAPGAGLAILVPQAIALQAQYTDYVPVLHRAITHEEPTQEPRGYLRMRTAVDYPEWIELRPAGDRIVPAPIEVVAAARIESLLARRSWIWRFHAQPAEEERALQRIAALRVFLAPFVEELLREGVLSRDLNLASAYLIGSYPWVMTPEEIEVAFVVRGEHPLTTLSSELLEARGIRIPQVEVGAQIEVVGWESLVRASRGEPGAEGPLALRHTLLYGSVLLAGDDLYERTSVGVTALEALREHLLGWLGSGRWIEQTHDDRIGAAKRAWGKCEAEALAAFIPRAATDLVPPAEALALFEGTQNAALIAALTPILEEGFYDVAQAVARKEEQTGLQAFHARFGVHFREARSRLAEIARQRGYAYSEAQTLRPRSARSILAACAVPLQSDRLLLPAQSPSGNSLLRPAGASDADNSHLLRPAPREDEQSGGNSRK